MKKYLLLLPTLAILASCNENVEEANPTNAGIDLSQGETAFLDQSGKSVEAFYGGQEVVLNEVDGQYVLNGDIIVGENELLFVAPPAVDGAQEESVGRTRGRWANNTVYYTISSSLPNQRRVTDAIAHWEANTNLTFVRRTNQRDYVTFRSGSGCSSRLGRVGGQQFINLASGCSTGNTIHEIGHAVGLYHEHTRGDRDTFVTVNFNNIQRGRENNFQTYVQRGTDGRDYTSTLDFGSVMMYGSFAFSSNDRPTITRKNGSTFNVQRNGLSSDDIRGIDQMYPGNGNGGGGGGNPDPQYQNNQWYTIDGLRVYRYNNRWYYYTSSNGWRQVVNRNGQWFYA